MQLRSAIGEVEQLIKQHIANDIGSLIANTLDTDYIHPEGDSPTKKQYDDIFYALCSYAFYGGSLTDAEVVVLCGKSAMPSDQISTALDVWR